VVEEQSLGFFKLSFDRQEHVKRCGVRLKLEFCYQHLRCMEIDLTSLSETNEVASIEKPSTCVLRFSGSG
jgi:hypothetical protein